MEINDLSDDVLNDFKNILQKKDIIFGKLAKISQDVYRNKVYDSLEKTHDDEAVNCDMYLKGENYIFNLRGAYPVKYDDCDMVFHEEIFYEEILKTKPIINHEDFIKNIKYREDLCNEVLEQIGYLSYDLNPIGGGIDMLEVMKKNSLEQINKINIILEKIRKSLNDE